MSETTFKLAYDGEAVRFGEMDVADLAPALLGLGQAVKIAGAIAFGEQADIKLKIQTTREGSFEVWLALLVDHGKTAWEFWKTEDVQAAAQLAGLLGVSAAGSAVGLLQFVRWLKGRQPEAVARNVDSSIDVTIENVTITVDARVYHMAFDPNLRGGLERAVAEPLDKDGIDEVRFGEGPNTIIIGKPERHSFRSPLLSDGDEFVSRHTRPFSIVSLSFKHGQKWKLSDGHGSPRSVTMSDTEFVDRVDRSEVRFAKGDVLICEVVERARRTPVGFKSEYEIVKVLQHQPAQQQPRLDGI